MDNNETLIVYKNGDDNIFTQKDEYMIPLYQRAFAWTDKEINQLVEDINDIDSSADYYLGSLIVYKREDKKYEVIDGQQRLTALFLLLNSDKLGTDFKGKPPVFDCREKANATLKGIKNTKVIGEKDIDNQIIAGIESVKTALSSVIGSNKDKKDTFKSKLQNLRLFRIEVPEHTDLNRYFEIMNTRGEQLEPQDIVKADLMSELNGNEMAAFAEIWDACSDMTGYVQMHIPAGKYRDILFEESWEKFPNEDKFNKFCENQSSNDNEENITIGKIIDSSFEIEKSDGENEKEDKVRFESIIDFKYFLLHVLRVYIQAEKIENEGLQDSLDDKKLISDFKNIKKKFKTEKEKADFSIGFIKCLLQVRFLFDKYIIKREFMNDDLEGVWSLQELHVSGAQKNKKPYYSNTSFRKDNEWTVKSDNRNKENLMIQSCLRVSYTSPKAMHWITKLLYYLYSKEKGNSLNVLELSGETEMIAKEAVRASFFEDEKFDMGTETPHIVFNYLDFILWKEDRNNKLNKYKDFNFEFRNSVEHWYPQHPNDNIPVWDDKDLNYFGNLCLLQKNINSRFSNLAPTAKIENNSKMIEKGSIKLRIMSEQTRYNGKWEKNLCEKHGTDMIEKLRKACETIDKQ